jgi:hypothetical protein
MPIEPYRPETEAALGQWEKVREGIGAAISHGQDFIEK